MELPQLITSFPFILTFIILFIFLLNHLKKSKSSLLLPPGPSKLPFIGHLHHLLGLPHHSLRDLANKHGPLMYLQLGQLSTIVVSSPSVAKQVMQTHDILFADRPDILSARIITYGCKDIAFAPCGKLWTQLRKVCLLELLSAKRVQSFWSVREEEVLNLIASISLIVGTPMNLSIKFSMLSNDITARASFGKTCKDKQAFIALSKEALRMSAGFGISDLFPSMKFLGVISGIKAKAENIHQKIDKMLDKIIREHMESRMLIKETGEEVEEDLLDVLLRMQEGGELGFPITTENVKGVIFDMFIAGTDTSSTLMEWTFSELLRNPRVMNKAQTEVRRVFNGKKKIKQADVDQLSYLGLVIKETLRMHPPGPFLLPRECRESCEIEGYEIPKGTKVIVNAWAIGRDAAHWRDPDKFEPERFQDLSIDYKGTNFEYIPFGAGRRICPGILFAMANIELPIAMLLYHFDWQIANKVKPDELDMTEFFGINVGRKNELYVVPTSYNP